MIKIPIRTKAIASLINKDNKVIDIGCDHALLAIYLVNTLHLSKVIASDINSNALQRGIDNIKKYNLEDKILFKLGNGLEIIDDDIDTIVIAGLGGITISDILKQGKHKLIHINNIILQPNTDIILVRRTIQMLGYKITQEQLVKENNIIYTIIKAEKGPIKYNYRQLYFGPILLKQKGELFIELYTNKINELYQILNMLPNKYLLKRWQINKKIGLIKKIISY